MRLMLKVLAMLVLLAGCAGAPAPQAGYRAAGTPIYSNAVFQPERLAGRWVQVADFAPAGAGACAARGLTVTPGAAGQLAVEADLCLGGETRRYAGPAEVSGPGRVRLAAADPAKADDAQRFALELASHELGAIPHSVLHGRRGGGQLPQQADDGAEEQLGHGDRVAGGGVDDRHAEFGVV